MALARIGSAAGQFARTGLNTITHYKSELLPPSPGEIPEAIAGASRVIKTAMTFGWKDLTVKEAVLNTFVGVEVACWFFVGECIGKGALIGYKV